MVKIKKMYPNVKSLMYVHVFGVQECSICIAFIYAAFMSHIICAESVFNLVKSNILESEF